MRKNCYNEFREGDFNLKDGERFGRPQKFEGKELHPLQIKTELEKELEATTLVSS